MPDAAASESIDVSDVSEAEKAYAAGEGEDPPWDSYTSETPFDCFKRPDVIDQLRQHPVTRPYSLDQGFLNQIEEIKKLDSKKDQQKISSMIMKDPRMTQAMSALQGWGLSVTEKEMKHAESVGDAPKRDAVQMPHYEYAHQFTTPQAAKDAGNECFKDGRYAEALACWSKVRHLYAQLLEKGPQALVEAGVPAPEPSLPCTLHSNSAAALLKMERPDDALKELESAIKVAPANQDLSKVYHRQSQAHEAKAKLLVNAEKAEFEMSEALESARMALTAAKDAETAAMKKLDSKAAGSKEVAHLQRELKRLKEADKVAKAAGNAKREQAKRNADADKRRAKGLQQEVPVVKPGEGQIVSKPTVGYVRDIDLSTFSTGWLRNQLTACKHTWGDGEIEVTQLDTQQSDIHVSIKEKRGKRALYYDLTLVMRWTGKSRLGRGRDSYGQMEGILKMYNVGQDTKFELGGDKETSYMYELGFASQYHSTAEVWATDIKEKAGELFETVSLLIGKSFVPAVESKGELVK